jgi:hypothetical protein
LTPLFWVDYTRALRETQGRNSLLINEVALAGLVLGAKKRRRQNTRGRLDHVKLLESVG